MYRSAKCDMEARSCSVRESILYLSYPCNIFIFVFFCVDKHIFFVVLEMIYLNEAENIWCFGATVAP